MGFITQKDIIEYKFVRDNLNSKKTITDLENKLIEDIGNYYHKWLSPIDRKEQLLSNLKRGFTLLLFCPLIGVIAGAISLWESQFAKGLIFFFFGNLFNELYDFSCSRFFDNPTSFNKKKGKINACFFVIYKKIGFIARLCLIIAISILIIFWPKISLCIANIIIFLK